METMAFKRVQNELKSIRESPPTNWKVFEGASWRQWDVWITADNQCPFHSIPIKLLVVFPEEYPKVPPHFQFPKPEIFFHPNIWKDGRICEDTIKQSDMTLSVRDRVNAIVTLFNVPNPLSPTNSTAASLYRDNPKQYNRRALRIFRGLQKK